MISVEKNIEDAQKVIAAYYMGGFGNHDINNAAKEIERINIAEQNRCAEKAIAFIDNNYNDFGEWDQVAFDDLRAAIKATS